jgi:shikimate dehydrogenase
MPELYGIIGLPLEHSFSPDFFEKKFAAEGIAASYERFPLEQIEALPALLKMHPSLRGLNVTAPYKSAVIPFLDSISEDAEALGAVNCISIVNGKLHGFNTDWQAFAESLSFLRPGESVLILGNGGAAKALRYALGRLGITHHTVCRRPSAAGFSFENLSADTLQAHRLIVNSTPLGTLGKGLPPLRYEDLQSRQMLYDLVYNPPLTPFLNEGIRRGLLVKNGLEMLQRQALLSWEIWQQNQG